MSPDAFRDREKGFEQKFQMDEDQKFRVHSRRDHLFGRWLAERFGLTGDDAEKYAMEVVDSNFEKPGDEDLMGKVKADVVERNINIEEKELRTKFEELLHEATGRSSGNRVGHSLDPPLSRPPGTPVFRQKGGVFLCRQGHATDVLRLVGVSLDCAGAHCQLKFRQSFPYNPERSL